MPEYNQDKGVPIENVPKEIIDQLKSDYPGAIITEVSFREMDKRYKLYKVVYILDAEELRIKYYGLNSNNRVLPVNKSIKIR